MSLRKHGSKWGSTVALAGLLVLEGLLAGVAWIVVRVINEGMDSKLMAMDDAAPKDTVAWKWNETWEILPGWLGMALVWLLVFQFVHWLACRRLVHLLS